MSLVQMTSAANYTMYLLIGFSEGQICYCVHVRTLLDSVCQPNKEKYDKELTTHIHICPFQMTVNHSFAVGLTFLG